MEQEKMNFYKNGLISIKAFYSIAWLFVAGILSLFIFVILGVTSRNAFAENTEQALSTEPGDQLSPAIFGNKIVWTDIRGLTVENYLYDLTNNTKQKIYSFGTLSGPRPGLWDSPDISCNNIVFGNHLYNISSNSTVEFIADPPDDYSRTRISGNKIVYADKRGNNLDIYLFNLVSNIEQRITTDSADQETPAIFGNNIVYSDRRNGNYDIYLYDLSTNTEKQITTDLGEQNYPQISGNKIVWLDSRYGNPAVFSYDLATNQEIQLAHNTSPLQQWPPVISGDKVAWFDNRYGYFDIILYDLTANIETLIPLNTQSRMSVKSYLTISDNKIAWSSAGAQSAFDIYYYEFAQSSQSAMESCNTPPSIPADPTVNIASCNSTALFWAGSTDDTGVAGYKIYRNGIYLTTVAETQYTDPDLSPYQSYTYEISAIDTDGNESPHSTAVSVKMNYLSDNGILAAPLDGAGPQLRLFDATGILVGQFFAYEKLFKGGVSIAITDLECDGKKEIITGPGSGRNPEVRIFTPQGKQIDSFLAFGSKFQGGVNVAAGDIDGDGKKEIITTTKSASPHIRIFGQRNGKWIPTTPSFFAYSVGMKKGVNIATGDLEGDGTDEIMAVPGIGATPLLKVFGVRDKKIKLLTPPIHAFSPNFKGGVNVSTSDIDGDNQAEILVSPASNGAPKIRVFALNAKKRIVLLDSGFYAFNKILRTGIDIASGDIDGDSKTEIFTSIASKGQPLVRIFSPDGKKLIREFKAYPQDAFPGVMVERW